jgi:co-chaperonin GroES (HSP10)
MFVPTPIGNQMIVLPDAAKTMTDGGLHIPDTAQNKNQAQMATVLALGTGEKVRELFQTRQRIMIKRMMGTPIDYMGIEALQLDMAHVLVRFDFVVPDIDVIEDLAKTDEGRAKLQETLDYAKGGDGSFDWEPEDQVNLLNIEKILNDDVPQSSEEAE